MYICNEIRTAIISKAKVQIFRIRFNAATNILAFTYHVYNCPNQLNVQSPNVLWQYFEIIKRNMPTTINCKKIPHAPRREFHC